MVSLFHGRGGQSLWPLSVGDTGHPPSWEGQGGGWPWPRAVAEGEGFPSLHIQTYVPVMPGPLAPSEKNSPKMHLSQPQQPWGTLVWGVNLGQ